MTEPIPSSPSERELADVLAKHHAHQEDWQRRATEAQSKAAQAYARLLHIAEDSDSGQARRVFPSFSSSQDAHLLGPIDL